MSDASPSQLAAHGLLFIRHTPPTVPTRSCPKQIGLVRRTISILALESKKDTALVMMVKFHYLKQERFTPRTGYFVKVFTPFLSATYELYKWIFYFVLKCFTSQRQHQETDIGNTGENIDPSAAGTAAAVSSHARWLPGNRYGRNKQTPFAMLTTHDS